MNGQHYGSFADCDSIAERVIKLLSVAQVVNGAGSKDRRRVYKEILEGVSSSSKRAKTFLLLHSTLFLIILPIKNYKKQQNYIRRE